MKSRVLLGAVLCALLAAPVVAQMSGFTDVPEDHRRAEAIRWAVDRGIFRGYPGGEFRPDEEVSDRHLVITARRLGERWSRADWAHVLWAASGFPATTSTTTTTIAIPVATVPPPPPRPSPPPARPSPPPPPVTGPPRTSPPPTVAPTTTAAPSLPPAPGIARKDPGRNTFWTSGAVSAHLDRDLPYRWYLHRVTIDGEAVPFTITGERGGQSEVRIHPSPSLHPGEYNLAMEIAPGGRKGTDAVATDWEVPLSSWRPRVLAHMETSFYPGGWGSPGKWKVTFSMDNPVEDDYEVETTWLSCFNVGTPHLTCTRWELPLGRGEGKVGEYRSSYDSDFRPGPVECQWKNAPPGAHPCEVKETGDWPEYGPLLRQKDTGGWQTVPYE